MFYLWLYGIEHVLNDHSDNERKPAAGTTWAVLSNWQQRNFYIYHPTDRIACTTAFVIAVVEH